MEYYSSSSLKTEGKRALEGKWQTAILVCFVPQLISLLVNMFNMIGRQTGTFVFQELVFQGVSFATNVPVNSGAVLWTAIILLVNIFLVPSLSMGVYSYFMAIHRGQNPTWGQVFSQLPRWWRNVRLSLAVGLMVVLGTVLFVVPGVLAALAYALSYYLVIDDPQMGVVAGMGASREMMKGKKMFYLVLNLSFIGWSLLISMADVFIGGSVIGLVVVTIANLFLQVYLQSTMAAFYNYIKN